MLAKVKRPRKRITTRTAERLVKLAFLVEELANRLKEEGHDDSDVRHASRVLGDEGRRLRDKLES